MTANITFQCFWGQQPAARQDSQSWVGCGKTTEITALDINLSVLSHWILTSLCCPAIHSSQKNQTAGKRLNLDSPPLWRGTHVLLAALRSTDLSPALLNPLRKSHHQPSMGPPENHLLALHHSWAHMQLRMPERSRKKDVHSESRIPGHPLPLKHLAMRLGHRLLTLFNGTSYGKFHLQKQMQPKTGLLSD